MKNTEDLLREWGKWSRGGYGLHACSAMAMAMELVKAEDNRIAISISDDDALRVDKAVCDLKRCDSTRADILRMYFILDWGERQIALHLKVSRDQVAKNLASAKGWVDCSLNNFSDAA